MFKRNAQRDLNGKNKSATRAFQGYNALSVNKLGNTDGLLIY